MRNNNRVVFGLDAGTRLLGTDQIIRLLGEEIGSAENSVLYSVKNYEEYCRSLGKLLGLKRALEVLLDFAQQGDEDDNN